MAFIIWSSQYNNQITLNFIYLFNPDVSIKTKVVIQTY